MNLMNNGELRMKSLAVLLGGTALTTIAAIPANALTASGTEITNTASITYDIGGQPQDPPPDAQVTFTVDRIIDVTVDYIDGPAVVNPNTTYTFKFTVANDGNATQDYGLDTLTPFGTVADDGDGVLEEGEYLIWIDDGDGIRNAGDTLYLGDPNQLSLAKETSATVFIDVWTDSAMATTDDSVELLATTYETDGVTLPTATADGSFDPNVVDTVFLDTDGPWSDAGDPDVNQDAQHSDESGNVTAGVAELSIVKTVEVMEQPAVGGAPVTQAACLADNTPIAEASAAYLPGSCLRYSITVTNSGDADAANVRILDDLTTNVTGGLLADWVGLPAGYNLDFDGAAAAYSGAADYEVTATDAVLASGGGTVTLVFHVLVE